MRNFILKHMKVLHKTFSIILAFLLAFTVFHGMPVTVSAEQLWGSITVSLPDDIKVGQDCREIQPIITTTGFPGHEGVGYKNTDFVIEDASVFNTTGNGFVLKQNNFIIDFWLYPVCNEEAAAMGLGTQGQVDYSGRILEELYFFGGGQAEINGQLQNEIMVEENHFNNVVRKGLHALCYVSLDLSDRTTYSISLDTSNFTEDMYLIMQGYPNYAEAGVTLGIPLLQYSDESWITTVDYYTLNGERYNEKAPVTMPAEDVKIGVVTKTLGLDKQVITDVNIDFEIDHEDVYYGERCPSESEFLSYIKSITTTSGVNLNVNAVDAEFMETKYGDWTSYFHTVIWIEAPEGYSFIDPAYGSIAPGFDEDKGVATDSPRSKWFNENFSLTFCNSADSVKEAYTLSTNMDPIYSNGIFIKYVYAAMHQLEIHLAWGTGTAPLENFDISGYKQGETVTIPSSAWQYDCYRVVGYKLYYSEDGVKYNPYNSNGFENGKIQGSSFVMPENGNFKIYAEFIRGFQTVKQEENSKDKIQLEVEKDTFGSDVILNIELVDDPNDPDFENDNGEESKEIMNRVGDAMGDTAKNYDIYELSAISLYKYVQPSKKILASFTIPEGYDVNSLYLYHIDEEGNKKEIPITVAGNTVYAYIEHFSTYVLAEGKTANPSYSYSASTSPDSPPDPSDPSMGETQDPIDPPNPSDPDTGETQKPTNDSASDPSDPGADGNQPTLSDEGHGTMNPTTVILIVVAMVIILGGAAGFVLMKKKQKKDICT